jgi:regulator of replication initiation timing
LNTIIEHYFFREENKHLREKLDQKKKEDAKNAATKVPIGRDVRQQQDKFYLKKSDQSK